MTCLEAEGNFGKEKGDGSENHIGIILDDAALIDKLFLMKCPSFRIHTGFWNLNTDDLTWDNVIIGDQIGADEIVCDEIVEDSMVDDTIVVVNEKVKKQDNSYTLPADSGNVSAETSFLFDEEEGRGELSLGSIDEKTFQQHHGGRVLVLEFRSLQGLSVSHVIKHIEKMGPPIFVLERIRTLFIQLDVDFDRNAGQGYPFYRVFMVHFSCSQALESIEIYESDFLVKHRFVATEDSIRFIPSSPHWYVATPILVKYGYRELTWSRILPPDYHVNKGYVKFEFRRLLTINQVELYVKVILLRVSITTFSLYIHTYIYIYTIYYIYNTFIVAKGK